MARLFIENIGPIKHVNIDLNRVNVFIGPQSSGKSTIAKLISFCSWMEKHNEATEEAFERGLVKTLKEYYRMSGYFNEDSVFLYEGEDVDIAYNCELMRVSGSCNFYHIHPKEFLGHHLERTVNPKVLYIPAERNFVSSVPNLKRYTEDNDSLQSFINDWFEAKRHFSPDTPLDIKPLGIKYYYNEKADRDYFVLDETVVENSPMMLNEGSSGQQSLVPLMVLVDWISRGIYETAKPFSPIERERIKDLLTQMSSSEQEKQLINRLKGFLGGKIYSHSQFVIEEPEQNLFPSTQKDLLYSLLASINHGRNHKMVITTHSPYILYALNNAMMAYLVKDNAQMPDKVRETIGCLGAAFDPKQVSVWQIQDGCLVGLDGEQNGTIQDKNGLIRRNYFDSVMGDIMSDFNNMVNFYEP